MITRYHPNTGIPQEVQDGVLAACQDGMSQSDAARQFEISQSTVCKILGRLHRGKYPRYEIITSARRTRS